MAEAKVKSIKGIKNKFELLDLILIVFLSMFAVMIVLPFVNVIAISFSSHREYLTTPLMLFPRSPTLENYKKLFEDGRIWVGYRSSLQILGWGLPVNMLFTITIAYGLSRPNFPGKRFIF